MSEQGPPLEALTRRLAECPAEFLEEPLSGQGNTGKVDAAAVVADLLRDLGSINIPQTVVQQLRPATLNAARRNAIQTTLVAAWLLHDPWFRTRGAAAAAGKFLLYGTEDPAALVTARQWVADPDRREELVRLCLDALGLRPAGESEAEARDRLATVSSVERRRVLHATRTAERRAAEIREAMRKKAAEEAAARYSPE